MLDFITKWGSFNVLQSKVSVYYKVEHLFYYKVEEVVLQSMTAITKWVKFISKCGRHYNVEQYLQHIVC